MKFALKAEHGLAHDFEAKWTKVSFRALRDKIAALFDPPDAPRRKALSSRIL
jgi:hypothetical protein